MSLEDLALDVEEDPLLDVAAVRDTVGAMQTALEGKISTLKDDLQGMLQQLQLNNKGGEDNAQPAAISHGPTQEELQAVRTLEARLDEAARSAEQTGSVLKTLCVASEAQMHREEEDRRRHEAVEQLMERSAKAQQDVLEQMRSLLAGKAGMQAQVPPGAPSTAPKFRSATLRR
mmetsp:Transcript_2567/g.7731  ORF Transcript_2567/g.7731 Transcript_2567/m.7731 type:complete len:174 (-) Transcript_2567:150-671(-)